MEDIMKVVVQRVKESSVTIDGSVYGTLDRVFYGFGRFLSR